MARNPIPRKVLRALLRRAMRKLCAADLFPILESLQQRGRQAPLSDRRLFHLMRILLCCPHSPLSFFVFNISLEHKFLSQDPWGVGEEATGEGVRKNVLRFRGRVVLPPRPLSAGLALIHTPFVGPRPKSAPSLGPLPKRRGLRLLLPTLGPPPPPPCCFTPSFDLLPYRGQDPVELPTWCLPPRAPAAPGPASSPQDAHLPEPCLPVEIHLDSSLPPKSGPMLCSEPQFM